MIEYEWHLPYKRKLLMDGAEWLGLGLRLRLELDLDLELRELQMIAFSCFKINKSRTRLWSFAMEMLGLLGGFWGTSHNPSATGQSDPKLYTFNSLLIYLILILDYWDCGLNFNRIY